MGRKIRAIRHRRRWRQQDLADRAGTSQDMVSRLERGRVAAMAVGSVREIAQALDAEVVLVVRWRGGELDRLMDEAHATLVGRAVEMLQSLGWETRSEVSFSVYGERGSIDVLAWHAPTRTLLVVEVKSELISVEETLRVHDAKLRLAPRIAAERFGWHATATARLLVLPDLSTARRRVARHRAVLAGAYPLRGHVIRAWLLAPTPVNRPTTGGGLLFLSPTQGTRGRNGPVTRKRVQRRASPTA